MPDTAGIDRVLQEAVKAGDVPGVVAAAGNADGILYEGAFGRRSLAGNAAMSMDSIFRIASMTKAVTTVAAMQMVEQEKLSLDQPASAVVPELANLQVLEGFAADGTPQLRPARRPVTLRGLLTHTSGFVYDTWNENLNRYATQTGLPAARTGKLAALNAPLGFEQGDRWEYGIGIDWAGRMTEAVSGLNLEQYMQKHILGPLGMRDTTFDARPDWGDRLVQVHAREADGSLHPVDSPIPSGGREFYPGGGGLFSTAHDYLRFERMLARGGDLDGARVLKPETVALMAQNHIGDLNVQLLKTYNPRFSNDAEFFPGMVKKWGLSFLINTEAVPGGRSAGSLAWAGLNNTYFWVDPVKRIAGLLMTQILPFADPVVLRLLDAFEREVYRTA